MVNGKRQKMKRKMMVASRNSIRRYVAWLLVFTTLFACVNPATLAYSAEEKNWEVEYWLETEEGIPLATEGDGIQLAIKENDSVAIGMMLTEGRKKSARRFGESFHIYMPEKLYDLITENGENPIEGFLESELATEGYLLEAADRYVGEATGSNASASNATGSNATGSNTTEEGVYKLTFRFAEDLRKADDPKTIEVEDTEGKLFFTAPENALLTLTQEGNDCRITMESLTGRTLMAPMSESGMDISLELYKDYVQAGTGKVTWEPTYYTSSAHITTKINYSESASAGYGAGEITITVYGTMLDSLSEYWDTSTTNYELEYNVTTNDMWEYAYDADKQAFVFTNKAEIAAGSTFSGFFEITWGATGRLKAGDYDFYAELKAGETSQETDICTFTVKKSKKPAGTYNKTAYNAQSSDVVAMYSKLPENKGDYYWVGYDLYRYITQNSVTTLMMEYQLTDEFPEGCVVLNSTGSVITLNENNEYVINSGRLGTSHTPTTRIYVGYPISMFPDGESKKTVSNTFNIAARYEDEDEQKGDSFSATCTVDLVEFDFSYTGDQYSISKTGYYSTRKLPRFKLEGNSTNEYYIYPKVGNPQNVPRDIIIGDDILYISREGGSTTRLQEDEYRFNSVSIPSFSRKTGETYTGYPYTLEILEKGENNYKKYSTGKLPATSTTFSFGTRNVVAWRVTVHGIDGPVDSGYLLSIVDVFASDAAVGQLHNFCYLQVKDQSGNILNEPDLGDYATIDTQGIAAFDKETYGAYMQRDVFAMAITEVNTLEVGVYKSAASTPVYDKESNAYNVTYRLDSAIGDIEFMLLEDTYMTSVAMYDILPDGVYVDPQKITMNYLSGYATSGTVTANAVTSALLQSGAKLNSRAEINDYLEKRTMIKIEEDYQGSGRTKVTATLDFSDDPLNVEDLQRQIYKYTGAIWYILFMRVSIPVIIPNAVAQENNGKISNYVFVETDLELPDGDSFDYKNPRKDNGSYGGAITSDINGNNDTTEMLGASVLTTNILYAGAAHYEMKKLVRTSSTLGQFVETGASSELDKVYTYLLRVCSAGSRLGNLIVYDSIEGVSGADGWQGNLQGFDLSDAVKCGVVPKVYYSTLADPDPLSPASISSGVWVPYHDSGDLSQAVTVAFDLRYDGADQMLILPEDTVLDLKLSMKAPATYDEGLENTKNKFYVDWELFDAEGKSRGEIETRVSNTVEVELKNVIIPSATLKLIKADEDKNPIQSDSARFELFYDVTGKNPVTVDTGGQPEPLVLVTSQSDGSATGSFSLDPYWKRYDDTYRVYVIETEVPDGYYYPGGSLDNPYMNYMVELTFAKDASGNYVVSDVSKNQSIYTIAVGDGNQVTLTIVDKEVKASETLAVTKTYTNGTLKGNDFTFKLKLTDAPAGSTVFAGTTEMTVNAGETLSVTNHVRGTATFPALVFDTRGTYTFALWEVQDESKGYIGYDSDVRTITISVRKLSHSILYEARVHNEEEDFSFTNTYTPVPMEKSLELTKILLHTDESEYGGEIPEFTFVMESVGSYGENVTMPAKLTAVNRSDGSIRFDAITFKRAGTYEFLIKEQNSAVSGITFDTTVIHATVTVVDDGAGTLSVKDNTILYTDSTDSTLKVSSFKNTLAPVTTQAGKGRFTATKSYLNWDNTMHAMTANEFPFLVTLLEQADGSAVKQGATELVRNQEFELGANRADGEIVFQDLTFDKAGTYVFAITEASDATKGYIDYSNSVYYAKVVVTIPANGKVLAAGVTYYKDAELKEELEATDVVFTNVYQPVKTTYALKANKELYQADGTQVMSGIPAYTFKLELDETSDPDAAILMPAATTAQNNGTGEIRFDELTFTVRGTYRFTIKETSAGGTGTGTISDKATVTVEIPVIDVNGQLTVDANNITYSKSAKAGTEADNTFVNKIVPVSGQFTAIKRYLNGDGSEHPMAANEFQFLVTLLEQAAGSAVKQGETELVLNQGFELGANQADGEVIFRNLTFDQVGTYVFAITEASDAAKGYIGYSKSVYYAKVVVTSPGNEKELAADVTYYKDAELQEGLEATDVVFTNVYQPVKTTYALKANKELYQADGTQVMSGIPAYTFKLELDETSDPDAVIIMPAATTAKNNGTGEIRFDEITFTIRGTYRFTIKETDTGGTGTISDKATITVEIPVTNVNGQLAVDVDNITYRKSAKKGAEEDNTFVNKIAPVSVDLAVTKTLTGRVLKDQEFTFQSELIYASGGVSFADRTAKNDSTGEVHFPSYTFTEAGTYVFKISEVQGSDSSIHYTNAVNYAKVAVTENQVDELVAEWYYGTGYNTTTHEVNGQLKEGGVPVFENTIRGYLAIRKVSRSTETPLKGAQFELSYRKAGSSDDWTVYGGTLETAGTDGIVSLELPDEYWMYEFQLIETKAPPRYSKARVGTILFTMGQDGLLASWSSSGTQGYVEISDDRTAIIVKNHATGGGGDGGGGGTTPTQPSTENPTEPSTEDTAPTVPETRPTQGDDGLVEIPGDPPSVIVEDSNGNIIYEGPTDNGYLDTSGWTPGTYTIFMLDDEGVPLGQMMVTITDNGTPLTGLAKTGDTSLPYALLLVIMLGAVGSMTALVWKRRKEK